MRWNVTGADPQTGAEISMQFEAIDEEDAEAVATRHGVYVSSVMPASEQAQDAKVIEYARPIAKEPAPSLAQRWAHGSSCPSCNKIVASNASTCPHCGHQFTSVVTFLLAVIVGTLLLVGLIASIIS